MRYSPARTVGAVITKNINSVAAEVLTFFEVGFMVVSSFELVRAR
jgi:hypothetical protein